MMERYRAELLRYQRATPPGKPTLAENLMQAENEIKGDIWQQDAVLAMEGTKPVLPKPILPPLPDNPVEQQSAKQSRVDLAMPKTTEQVAKAEQPLPISKEKDEQTEAEKMEYENISAAEEEPNEKLPPPAAIIAIPTKEPPMLCACDTATEFEKCIGAYGVFRPYERMGGYTKASFLQTPGEATEVLARFAADVPLGAADSARCRRSFCVKFFCNDGEYVMPSEHIPVMVGTDEAALADCCMAMRADPKTGLRSKESFWRFLLSHKEALTAAMWLYSDLGTIGSYRAMDGYSPPCLWINSKGEKSVVRTRWLSRQRPHMLSRFEAEELAGADPDAVARDLVNAITAGDKVQYELAMQIISPQQLEKLDFDPLDPTQTWSEERFKVKRIGLLTLDRLLKNPLQELEVSQFGRQNMIEGIEYPRLSAQKGIRGVSEFLREQSELSRRTLISNMTEDLAFLSAELLEKVLIFFSEADLEFGKALTAALGG